MSNIFKIAVISITLSIFSLNLQAYANTKQELSEEDYRMMNVFSLVLNNLSKPLCRRKIKR